MLSYSRSGSGIPVVFLHGFLEDSSIWNHINPNAIEKICVDLPGHGLSAEMSCSNISQIALLIIEILNSLNISKYSVVGHSMGGYIALELLKHDPKCKKLILLNSNFWQDSDEKKGDRQRIADLVVHRKDHFIFEAIPNLFADPEKYDQVVRRLITEARHMSSEAIANASIAMKDRIDHTQLVKEMQDRIMIIQGKYDAIVPVNLMKEKLDGINIKYCELPTAHMSVFEATKETETQIDEFVKVKNGN